MSSIGFQATFSQIFILIPAIRKQTDLQDKIPEPPGTRYWFALWTQKDLNFNLTHLSINSSPNWKLIWEWFRLPHWQLLVLAYQDLALQKSAIKTELQRMLQILTFIIAVIFICISDHVSERDIKVKKILQEFVEQVVHTRVCPSNDTIYVNLEDL